MLRHSKLFIFLLGLACQSRPQSQLIFSELNPLPPVVPLWGRCSEITEIKKKNKIFYKLAEREFVLGKKLGEGGAGSVYQLNPSQNNFYPHSLVIKFMHRSGQSELYDDLILHSTLMILGIPTTKAGLGYIQRKNAKEYVLIKEAVLGKTFDNQNVNRSLSAINFLNPSARNNARNQTYDLARIISRMINSGLWVEDLHSRNIMISHQNGELIVVDGTIHKNTFEQKIDPYREFGRAIGFPERLGDIIFGKRYYLKDEPPPSAQAVARAKERLHAYFASEPVPCETIAPNTQGFPLDVHQLFN